METRGSEGLEKPWKKSVSGSQETDDVQDKVRPELPSEDEKTRHANQETQDREPRRSTPIHRNSIFNRTVRRKSKGKPRDAPEQNTPDPADSLENGQSVNEPLTLNSPQSRMSRWRIPIQPDPGAKRTRSQRPPPSLRQQPQKPTSSQGGQLKKYLCWSKKDKMYHQGTPMLHSITVEGGLEPRIHPCRLFREHRVEAGDVWGQLTSPPSLLTPAAEFEGLQTHP
uniref:ephexin-1-like n=1 Tax=Halichoerus grypus TaxID=9711 RepID=UPI001659176D|nr:ephexin-1-like [Halichoerus grypus]